MSWLIEKCPKCGNQGQIPIDEATGEDAMAREAVQEYRETQAGDNPHTCCGAKMVASYSV